MTLKINLNHRNVSVVNVCKYFQTSVILNKVMSLCLSLRSYKIASNYNSNNIAFILLYFDIIK